MQRGRGHGAGFPLGGPRGAEGPPRLGGAGEALGQGPAASGAPPPFPCLSAAGREGVSPQGAGGCEAILS